MPQVTFQREEISSGKRRSRAEGDEAIRDAEVREKGTERREGEPMRENDGKEEGQFLKQIERTVKSGTEKERDGQTERWRDREARRKKRLGLQEKNKENRNSLLYR